MLVDTSTCRRRKLEREYPCTSASFALADNDRQILYRFCHGGRSI